MLLEYARLSLRAFGAIFAPLYGQRGWKLSALFAQMVSIGVASMPTVALANFLLGIVLAIQGAGQFEKLGAADLVARAVAFSVLRPGRCPFSSSASCGPSKARGSLRSWARPILSPASSRFPCCARSVEPSFSN